MPRPLRPPRQGQNAKPGGDPLGSETVEPGAAEDDPTLETPGHKLQRTSGLYYGKTVTKADVDEAIEAVQEKEEREQEREEQVEEMRRKIRRRRGGPEEPAG